jgi:HEAT repeat protein
LTQHRRTAPFRVAAVAGTLVLALAALASSEDASEAMKRLDTADPAARAAAAEAVRKLPDCEQEIARALRDGTVRASLGPRAVAALADLAGELKVRAANAGLRDVVADAAADLDARKAAARALATTGSVADVSALADAVRALPDEATRALVAIGGPSAASALRRGAGDDPPLEASAGLVLLGDGSQLARLTSALRGPDAARAGKLLAWATGHDLPAEPAAWDSYLRQRDHVARFADPDNWKAGDAAEEVAGRLRQGDAALTADVVAILRDASWPAVARDKAALALGLGGVKSAQEALLWACRDGEVGSVRMYAADALARVGDLSCAPVLVAMLNNDEDKDRISARRTGEGDFFPVDPCFVRALYRMGCRGAADRAIDLLAGEYRTRLHRDCLRALGEVSGGIDFAFEPDASKPERQAGVARIRAWWRDARETVPIAPRADDPGWPAFRKAVAENIETLGGFKFLYQLRAKNLLIDLAEPARPQLEAALSHANEHVRMGAADVLAGAGLRDAAAALGARLAEERNPAARTRLLAALEVCGRPWPDGKPAAGPEMPEAVRGALGDPSLDVRIAAARTLGVVGDLLADAPRLAAAKLEPRNNPPGVATFRFVAAASVLRLARRAALADIAAQLLSEDVAERADAAKALVAAGFDLQGYDPDLPPDQREAAVRRIEQTAAGAVSSVPYRERK